MIAPADSLRSPRRVWGDVVVVLSALFAYSMLETMIAPALPEMRRALSASPADLGWVFSSLLVVGAVATPIAGRLGDLYDKRIVLVYTMAIAGIGIVVAACSTGIVVLGLGQALQGVALGSLPLAIGLMNELLPRQKVSLGNALVVAAASSSTAIGLLAAGPIIETFGFRAVYWLPMVVFAPCVVYLAWPRPHVAGPKAESPGSAAIDWKGAAALAILLITLLIGLRVVANSGWHSPWPIACMLTSLVLFLVWLRYEKTQPFPLLDVRRIGGPRVGLTCLIAFALGFGTVGSHVLVPLLLHADPASGIGFAANATTIGHYLFPLGMAGLIVTPFIGLLERTLGEKGVMIVGATVVTAGVALPAFLHRDPWHIVLAMTMIGIGIALTLTEAMNTVVRSVPAERAASTSGAVLLLRTVGGTFGAQVCASILATPGGRREEAISSSAFVTAFSIAGFVTALSIAAALALPRMQTK